MNSLKDQLYWKTFIKDEKLTPVQEDQIARYITLLLDYNKHTNLTAITDVQDIISYHMQDSLALGHHSDLLTINSLADIGSGAGFPGIPLKIKYPHLSVVLIEVNQKKITFLESVIEQLGLENIEICPLDWRTFIRNTDYDIDIFCARASLQPEELIRICTPENTYHNATVVYWASEQWQPDKKIQAFIKKDIPYKVGAKKRRLIFLGFSS